MNNFEQRKLYILEQLEQKGSVSVLSLAETLDVSDMTIRRDLTELEKIGLLRRIHGGAINSRGRSYEPPLAVRSSENLNNKQMIGSYAADMVAEGNSIALDIGSTTYEVATNLSETRNITIITPSIPIASLFFERSDVRLILPGGIVRPGEKSLIGNLAHRNLEIIFVDRLFLGVGAVDASVGLTEYNMDDAAIKQALIKNAKEVIVVADSSKFGKIAFASVAAFNQIQHFITDQEPPEKLYKAMKNSGVTIHVVGRENPILDK